MTRREPTLAELAEDLDEIKQAQRDLSEKLDARYLPRELYESRHTALRSEIALQIAQLETKHHSTHRIATFSLIAAGTILASLLVAFLQMAAS